MGAAGDDTSELAEEIQVRHKQVRCGNSAQDGGGSMARGWAFSRVLLLAVDFRSREGGVRTRVRFGATNPADGAAGLIHDDIGILPGEQSVQYAWFLCACASPAWCSAVLRRFSVFES